MKINLDILEKQKLLSFCLFIIIFGFFISYMTLLIVKHSHFLTGYDIAVSDQAIWNYARLKPPITTILTYHDTSLLEDHLELIFILFVPFYWIFNDMKTLFFLQNILVCLSAIPIFLFARHKKLPAYLSLTLVISYLSFYGIQFAVWSDVHSLVFGVAFLAFFLYFLEMKNKLWSFVFFALAILSKEDIALFTLVISFIYFFTTRKRWYLIFCLLSVLYLVFAFGIFFPFLTRDGYRFRSSEGLLSHIAPQYLVDTAAKRETILYSLGWFGFLPILAPLYLLPALADLSHYFLIGHAVTSAQGLSMHYRSSLALFLIWPTILVLAKYKKLQKWYVALYLLICAAFIQYALHLPLSYLTKSWFWTKPASIKNIKRVMTQLPKDASVITQVNLTAQLSHREKVYTLFPQTKDFEKNSPCGEKTCRWFRTTGSPDYLLVDTSTDWDPRHFLESREDFIDAIHNLEKTKRIVPIYKSGTTTLYKTTVKPFPQ